MTVPYTVITQYELRALRAAWLSVKIDSTEVEIYNTALGEDVSVTNKDIIDLGSKLTWDVPYSNMFWYPSFSMTNNWYKFYAVFLLYQMIPALIVDGLLKIIGKKPMLVKVQRKIYLANTALIYFMQNSFKFRNEKCKALDKHTKDSGIKSFEFTNSFNCNEEEVYRFYINGKIASLETLFKEDFNRVKGFRNTMILWILDNLLHIFVYGVLCCFLMIKLQILTTFDDIIHSYLLYLNEL